MVVLEVPIFRRVIRLRQPTWYAACSGICLRILRTYPHGLSTMRQLCTSATSRCTGDFHSLVNCAAKRTKGEMAFNYECYFAFPQVLLYLFYFMSVNILLRFTVNMAIAPCICMPRRPEVEATSYPCLCFSSLFFASIL
jgi:hypothetical protein